MLSFQNCVSISRRVCLYFCFFLFFRDVSLFIYLIISHDGLEADLLESSAGSYEAGSENEGGVKPRSFVNILVESGFFEAFAEVISDETDDRVIVCR